MESRTEIIQIRYYNVLFLLIFDKEIDQLKKEILVDRIESGECIMMKGIYEWCDRQQIPFKSRFVYRKDFSIRANLWNLYSYCRFIITIVWKKRLC